MTRHLALTELNEGLPDSLGSPKDTGTLAGIVIRPKKDVRRELHRPMTEAVHVEDDAVRWTALVHPVDPRAR